MIDYGDDVVNKAVAVAKEAERLFIEKYGRDETVPEEYSLHFQIWVNTYKAEIIRLRNIS